MHAGCSTYALPTYHSLPRQTWRFLQSAADWQVLTPPPATSVSRGRPLSPPLTVVQRCPTSHLKPAAAVWNRWFHPDKRCPQVHLQVHHKKQRLCSPTQSCHSSPGESHQPNPVVGAECM